MRRLRDDWKMRLCRTLYVLVVNLLVNAMNASDASGASVSLSSDYHLSVTAIQQLYIY